MGAMGLKKILDMILEKPENKISYIKYKDSGGHELKEDEIIFTNEESFQGKQTLEVWGEDAKKAEFYTINSPGVEYVYDESGNFPIALRSPEGKMMYMKVSAKTGEVLPIHAGCCKSLDIIYTGPPQAGKTVSILQMSDPSFHDAIVRDKSCSFEDDLPSQSTARRRYEKAGMNLKNHILPERTHKGEFIMPYVYYVTYVDKDGTKRHMLVRLQDIDGEQCIDMSWQSKILPYDYFFLTIGADELIKGEQGLPVQYTKVVDQLIPRLRVLRRTPDYEMIVIISKADLLDTKNPFLEDAFTNSVTMINGKMYQTTHGKGFDYDIFNRRGECVRAYLKDQCPNFYNKLLNAVPQKHITFCMIASIGETGTLSTDEAGNETKSFKAYKPFCIDEPILSVLAKQGMYPISIADEPPKEEWVKGGTDEKISGFMKHMMGKMKLGECLEDDFDDYEED